MYAAFNSFKPEENGIVDAVHQVRCEEDHENKLKQGQTLLKHHAKEPMLLVVLIHPSEERV